MGTGVVFMVVVVFRVDVVFIGTAVVSIGTVVVLEVVEV